MGADEGRPQIWRIDIDTDESWELYDPQGNEVDSGLYAPALIEAVREFVSDTFGCELAEAD